MSVVGTVLVLRPDTNGKQSPNNGDGTSEFASANDTGPANIITDEPTCEAWRKISADLLAVSDSVKWNQQDYSVPGTEWTPEQRAAFETQGTALTGVIANVTNIAKQTPHRVMRELYAQYIAYSQAIIDAIPSYSAADRDIVAASNQFFTVLNRVCDAIYYRAAQETAPLITTPPPPSDFQAINSDGRLVTERFISGNDGSCSDWTALVEHFEEDARTKAWTDLDPNVRATDRTPEDKAVMDAAVPVLAAYADDVERLGRASGNPVWEDFAVLSAQYMRAYVQAVPTYRPSYGLLSLTSTILVNAVNWACKAEA
ncbi:hypothetical protein ABQF34_01935 [Mycolicibacterium boenickei]